MPTYTRKGAIYKKCLVCESEFGVEPYRVHSAMYCSSRCRHISPRRRVLVSQHMAGHTKSVDGRRRLSIHAKSRTGDKNPNWRGGKTPLILSIRGSSLYKTWRKEIFRRDNYTCRICGKPSAGDIEAHHVISVASMIRAYNLVSIQEAVSCEQLWSKDNGLTLCKSCHAQTDNYKGKRQ